MNYYLALLIHTHTYTHAAALAGGVHNTWLITAETKTSDCSLANCAHNAKRNFPPSLVGAIWSDRMFRTEYLEMIGRS